jgi:hypothetical protein
VTTIAQERGAGAEPAPSFGPLVDPHPRARQACARVAAVTRGGVPDRVPFIDSYWNEFADRYRRERGLPAEASLPERFDHDYCILAPVMGPWPSEARVISREPDGSVISRDEFGLLEKAWETRQGVPQHLGGAIKEKRDLDRLPFEDPTDPARSDAIAARLPEVSRSCCPTFKLGGPFSRSWRLRGLAQFLTDIGEDPPFAAAMVDRMTDHLIAVGIAVVKRLDWPRVHMHIADDFASTGSPLFSPAVYESIFLPRLKRMVDCFHGLGFRISYESEGNVWPMLDLLDASGIDGLAHMEPRAGMTIARIRERKGGRFFIMGNVCNTQVLPSNDRGRIAREVLRVLRSATDGHYMGLSAHSIGSDVTSDTYDYFFQLMDRHGRYPLDLAGLEEEVRREESR